jgi:hypothetical protein
VNKIRLVHLYLGCFFAPMLVFFAISGTWQELHLQWHNDFLNLLSTIHTGQGLKSRGLSSLSSPFLICFIVLMAASLVLNIILGIIMAFRFGRLALVIGSLAAGIVIPLLLILFFAR